MALFKKKKKLDTNSMEKGVYLVTVAKPTSVDKIGRASCRERV